MLLCDDCGVPLRENKCPICGKPGKWNASDGNSIATLKVDNLFFNFSFELPFNSQEAVSILIAPNGYGKTTLFHFLNFLLHPSYENLAPILGVPFKRIACIMKDGSEFGVALGKCNPEDTSTEVQNILSSQNGHLFYWYKDKYKNIHRWCLDRILKDNLSLYRRALKGYKETRSVENESKYILDQLFATLRNHLSIQNVKFIPADRLFVSEERKNSIYSDLNLNNMNETISKMIRRAKKEYEIKYIQVINKYMEHLVAVNLSRENSDAYYGNTTEKDIIRIKERLTTKWNTYSEKIRTYTELDLLKEYYKEKSYSWDFSGDDYDHTNKILIIVDELLTRLLEAMEPIDILYRKFELFLKIINERLAMTDKKISLYQGKLIVLSKATEGNMPIAILSSGEKNDLFLFYELIFSTDDIGLVLIDEPEISWHIEWQMSFIDRLMEICEINHFQAVVATHSPSIINGHIDLIAERVNKYYV